MMKCTQIRELLLTDYLDGEIESCLKQQIDAHLCGCTGCRQLLDEVTRLGRAPFIKGCKVNPPDSVWLNIKATIEEDSREQEMPGLEGRIFGFLQSFFQAHRPAFAVTTIMSVAIIGVLIARIPQRNRYALNTYLQSQAQYLAAGNGENVSAGFGTAIEEFFL